MRGYVNAFVDEDGVPRSARGQIHVQDQTISLLSVEAASLYLGMLPKSFCAPSGRTGAEGCLSISPGKIIRFRTSRMPMCCPEKNILRGI